MGRCLLACPQGVLFMSENLNARGYHYMSIKEKAARAVRLLLYCPELWHWKPYSLKRRKPNKQKEEKDGNTTHKGNSAIVVGALYA